MVKRIVKYIYLKMLGAAFPGFLQHCALDVVIVPVGGGGGGLVSFGSCQGPCSGSPSGLARIEYVFKAM